VEFDRNSAVISYLLTQNKNKILIIESYLEYAHGSLEN